MTKPRLFVRALEVTREGRWSFADSSLSWQAHRYGARATFDPFPCYPHQLCDVEEAAEKVSSICPPLWNVELYVADREEVSRSNGHSNVNQSGRHDEGDKYVKDPPVGLILLSGKRIPPHPAMTRYLVAHEYGHNVEWMLNIARGFRLYDENVLREYAEMRGLPEDHLHYGDGANWHRSAAEIFACDFRIVVTNTESEHWPHEGVEHPHDRWDAVSKWWAKALSDLDEAREKGVTFE
jgi:hypothetical protein